MVATAFATDAIGQLSQPSYVSMIYHFFNITPPTPRRPRLRRHAMLAGPALIHHAARPPILRADCRLRANGRWWPPPLPTAAAYRCRGRSAIPSQRVSRHAFGRCRLIIASAAFALFRLSVPCYFTAGRDIRAREVYLDAARYDGRFQDAVTINLLPFYPAFPVHPYRGQRCRRSFPRVILPAAIGLCAA